VRRLKLTASTKSTAMTRVSSAGSVYRGGQRVGPGVTAGQDRPVDLDV
jgi:hypothetical protein